MCHTLYCLCVLYREPDSQQIAGVWYDLAAALFRAFTDKDGEGEDESSGEKKWKKKKNKEKYS